MADASRRYIINRRSTTVADLSEAGVDNGAYSMKEAKSAGMYKLNCTHQIGIATATEVGLSMDRFPVRVILSGTQAGRMSANNDTVVKYWKVSTVSKQRVPFQRKALPTDLGIKNLYKYVPELDEILWGAYLNARAKKATEGDAEGLSDLLTGLVNILLTPNPVDEQVALIPVRVAEMIVLCDSANVFPRIKITIDHYLWAFPHGTAIAPLGEKDADQVAIEEVAACILLNEKKMKSRYGHLKQGAITIAAYCVASMFRYGFAESYEHNEYVTVTASAVSGVDGQYTVSGVSGPPGSAEVSGIAVGDVITTSAVKFHPNLAEFSTLLVWTSGLMHYLFNHTTGGSVLTGPLLTSLGMYGIVGKDSNEETLRATTSLFYEALHPVNKRAIANLFFPSSAVTSHGRLSGLPRYEKFSLDAFASIRKNPYPAGSHKAYVCLMALKRVLQAGLAPFLPWANEISSCVNTCKEVLQTGARAHIGAQYYTGEPPVTQPSSIDAYLPELAAYVQNFNRGDSLTLSPHLSPEQAARANMNWTNLLKEIRSKDVSAVNVDVVRKFLSSQGTAIFNFDPEDPATWGNASDTARVALSTISNIFN